MIDIETYLSQLIELLKQDFHARLQYVGLQGSYLRKEATDSSDIDIMVVIDDLCVHDLDRYRSIINSMAYSDKSCGFICATADLANWNPLEICHLVNSTKDCFGVLRELVPAYTESDIRNFVKLSLNNLYHEICHRYIHGGIEKSSAHLPATYKGVFFILQNLYFLQYGKYIATKSELMQLLNGKDLAVLKRSIDLNNGMCHPSSDSFELLFTWCQETLQSIC